MKSIKVTKARRIPRQLHKYFWDVDVKKLNPYNKPIYVISRLLDMGNVQAITWVNKHYPKELIKQSFTKYRGYSLKSASFWGLIYNVPKSQIICFQEPYLSTRRTLWPY